MYISQPYLHFYLTVQKYSITLLTGKPKGAKDWVMGQLFLSLYDDKGDVIQHLPISE